MIKHFVMIAGVMITSACAGPTSIVTKENAFMYNKKTDNYDNIRLKIKAYSDKHNVPFNLAYSIIYIESKHNPSAYGKGTYGLGQIKCGTAKGIGFTGNCKNLFDIDTNLEYTMKYLSQAMIIAKGNECYAATLYNRGLGNKPKSSAYCRKVLAKY